MVMQKVSELTSASIGNMLTNVRTWGGVIYNVKEYGAVGDGVTDDTAAINSAIAAALANGGGQVFFPPGEYVISQTIFVPAKVNIVGSGSGENASLAKTILRINGDFVGIRVVGRNVKLSAFLLTIINGLVGNTSDGIQIGDAISNAGRCIIDDVIVTSPGRNGMTLIYGNGCEINAKFYYTGRKGFAVEPGPTGDMSGCQYRIDAFGCASHGIDLANSSGSTLHFLSQSNLGSGVACSGFSNTILGYTENNGLVAGVPNGTDYGVLLSGNATGNIIHFVSFGAESPIFYTKGQLRTNNFVFFSYGEFTKGGYFATTRLRLDTISNLLSTVDTPTAGDILNAQSAGETSGKGLYKYDPAIGWIRLDGVTIRSQPSTAPTGLDIHDPTNGLRKYYDGASWQQYSRFVSVPASATATGKSGDWSADASYVYVCYATNLWRRVATSSW
ncbi:hypothetical protein AMQ84_27250 [Paenibacillus riograndensis]|uniref:Rhamnogalacturonase A/B/Epimerase-like pectate lyase domain-containing protein n=1 Tax=Paenibacillus riograndensis TaxID=483937 RepID=A0A132TJZ3_9BACL|nr:glycosyl hydrolase family 28-related protein [Paenibacillus riograndensis]KWX71621.1 hypothetical protein AMQ84_27250 [Paenibacillus riograndensis]